MTNTGKKEGTYIAKLSIDGEFKTQSITLKPDESEKITFEISREKAGTYQIKIGELSRAKEKKEEKPEEEGEEEILDELPDERMRKTEDEGEEKLLR
ncbi:hypothetical protein AKJ65_06420 [candidate division MSBL1 archaeon SCGC-AAA259E19]|uniref:CARDB domain-containing protein n=1 Tax=candidate division MSBL1 archaeon SCGC-AAA259E19 TaxID=1698264 RepID=A0A133UGL2_9EURY|nr:hypothetical protein AKJ65_06420 [candidate division MSBL1 archaeon SCGC-AAA259E19]